MKTLTLIFFIALTQASFAQDIGTSHIRWAVVGMEDVDNNKQVPAYTCTFETNGSNAAYWRQKNGTYSTKFTVQRIDGTWANIANEGQATFSITADGQTGTLLFEKNSKGTFITLDLSQPDGSRNVYKFTATQTTIL